MSAIADGGAKITPCRCFRADNIDDFEGVEFTSDCLVIVISTIHPLTALTLEHVKMAEENEFLDNLIDLSSFVCIHIYATILSAPHLALRSSTSSLNLRGPFESKFEQISFLRFNIGFQRSVSLR